LVYEIKEGLETDRLFVKKYARSALQELSEPITRFGNARWQRTARSDRACGLRYVQLSC
jgi:hypothetical protein